MDHIDSVITIAWTCVCGEKLSITDKATENKVTCETCHKEYRLVPWWSYHKPDVLLWPPEQ